MFRVIKHHPQIGIDDYGGGGVPCSRNAQGMVHPMSPVRSIQSTNPNPGPDFRMIEDNFPGFRKAWDKFPELPESQRMVRAIQELASQDSKPKAQYIYIEKDNRPDALFKSEGNPVFLIMDGPIQLIDLNVGQEYRFKIPGHTITCIASVDQELLVRNILSDNGGNTMQLYIPIADPLAKMLRVRRSVVTSVPTKDLPRTPPRVHIT